MQPIKSYTDIEQSRKLAEILPLESADMYYCYGMDIHTKKCGYDIVPTIIDADNQIDICDIPCWSLVALLEIIKKLVGYSLQSLDTHTVFMSCELGDKPYTLETKNYDNPVDACVAMIENLHELKML